MKINCKVLTMALGGAVLPWGLASAQDKSAFPKPLTSVGSLSDTTADGESTTIVPQRPTMTLDQRPAAFRENAVQASGNQPGKKGQIFHNVGYSTSINESSGVAMPIPDAAPMMSEPMMGSGYSAMPGSGCSTGSCGGGSCGGGSCSSGMCGDSGCNSFGLGSGCGGCQKRFWFETEAILWWGPETRLPPLVVSGPRFNPPDTLELGGERFLGGEMLPGMRTNFGLWLDDCQSIGIGGRVFGLFSDPVSYNYTSDGSRTLGVPFFDVSGGGPGARLVAFDSADAGSNSGGIFVSDDTDFFTAEVYGKMLLARTGCARTDIIGGYTMTRFDSSLSLVTINVDGEANSVLDGTSTTTGDLWSTRNEFHGGHIGFSSEINKGRLGLTTLGKVAIGTMKQEGLIEGTTIVSSPAPANSVTTSQDGLFSFSSNRGPYSRDVMSFIPEAGAKLRYQMKKNMTFAVGYTFLFLPDVVLASGMIDTNVDAQGALLGNPIRPAPKFDHGSYYLHGLDLGLTFNF